MCSYLVYDVLFTFSNFFPPVMVKVSKGTTNGTCKQSNDPDSKNNQKRMKTSMDSADEWSVDSLGDSSKTSKERPISHASDEGKFRFYCAELSEEVAIVML